MYRGRELVLSSTLDAANYNYIFEYGFRDDGTISFRLGATGAICPAPRRLRITHGRVEGGHPPRRSE